MTERTTSHFEEMIQIPNAKLAPTAEARASYSIYYELEDDDSPRESRASLAMRLQPTFNDLRPGSKVLDLGAGKGIFEKEYAELLTSNQSDSNNQVDPIQIVTLDIANIGYNQLLTRGLKNIHHVQASGTDLPFADNTFASGFSNLAIDFMPKQTLHEFSRVVEGGANIHVNLHHPDTITPPGIEEERWRLQRKIGQKIKYHKHVSIQDQMELVALKHKQYLYENNILFQSNEQIATEFENAGFSISDIRIATSLGEKWWEVDMKNSSKTLSRREAGLSPLW